ncbi:hypothetical protein CJ030_MR0G006179 [Morella rubra]|uniref:DUF4219 domain-containing protein n=1 Tax=Morella rubra TaxID=262757 RepID=A0A6A1UNZ2_9ROSI|nr:hypothetical protein CJ030_MR0G006179 [Morella rubra]
MEAKATLCKTALEVLDKNNYISWSVRVKTYLMTQDLWAVIDLVTESPKEEDDEATWKAWSKKNFMALHMIQNSCGPDSFYKIRKISSANAAWYKLEEIYNDMPKNSNSVIHNVLKKDTRNYENWSVKIKTYLMAQDLWHIIESSIQPPKQ